MGIVRSPWKKTRERHVTALGSNPLPRKVVKEIKEESEVQGVGEFSDFSPWDDSMIPEEPCVYVYYDRTERPIYVGQTNNLQRRNKQHQEQDGPFDDWLSVAAIFALKPMRKERNLRKFLSSFSDAIPFSMSKVPERTNDFENIPAPQGMQNMESHLLIQHLTSRHC